MNKEQISRLGKKELLNALQALYADGIAIILQRPSERKRWHEQRQMLVDEIIKRMRPDRFHDEEIEKYIDFAHKQITKREKGNI